MPPQKKDKGDVVGRKLVLNDLLTYQEGAVVSRALIDKKVGTVTFFSFDEEQGLSEHTAPYDAMVLITEGRVQIAIAGERFDLSAGDMIIMPANKPHSLRALEPFKMMLIMIRSEDKVPELVEEKI
jgi:quercetin dioxygenase-like cupin family protein